MHPLKSITVICICFNHEDWVGDALESVKNQNYPNLHLIIVDNASEDESPQRIKNWVSQNQEQISVKSVFKEEPVPYCALFNEILATVETDFVIDLSGDDVLLPKHLFKSVEKLNAYPTAAFSFSDAVILDEKGEKRTFYARSSEGELLEQVQEGDIYSLLIRRTHISAPTVVFRTSILKAVQGYDEALSYEDFDVQLRLARQYLVHFSNHLGVLKREHAQSMSASQYQRYASQMLPSTIKVCRKIQAMNKTPEEDHALKERICFELKHALFSANFDAAEDLVALGKELHIATPTFKLYTLWFRVKLDLSWLYYRLT